MANSMHSVDTEIYQRSVEVFRNKRNSLPPEHLKDLAAEVVQRLVAMRKNAEPAIEHDADAQQLSDFCAVLLDSAPERALEFVAKLQAQGVTRQHLRFGLIAGVATAAKGLNPDIEIIGVQTQRFPSMFNAVRQAELPMGTSTIAEGIAVTQPGELARKIGRAHV